MPFSFAADGCSVEIYPFEGGPLALQGGQIRSVTVSKSLLGGAVGQFAIELAPGGPQGPEDPNTWSKIITPMSHVLIGMSRGDDAAIVMDGVATGMGEAQEWSTTERGAEAARSQVIDGADFAWFFATFNFYALTFYGLVAGSGPGKVLNFLPQGLVPALSQGLVGGVDPSKSNPVDVGRLWFNTVMAGPNGILNSTFIPFTNGSHVTFSRAVTTTWENYPNVYIPLADYFMSEESWMSKFLNIFPHPWYEFFVTTASASDYPLYGSGYGDTGSLFRMVTMPAAPPAGPALVARVNPTPDFSLNSISAINSAIPGSMNVQRWNALPLHDFTTYPFGFINSDLMFSAEGAKNFYQLQPTYYSFLYGNSNAGALPSSFMFLTAVDPASVQRYGFRPLLGNTRWMCDPTGATPQNPTISIPQTILALTGKMISWSHPTPLMAHANVVIPLSPGIRVGTRFRYAPLKDGVPWDFYIEGIQHQFVFGGRSTTTLTLTRGLPTAVYEDTSDSGLLRAVHVGNAMRQASNTTIAPKFEGYTIGLPPGSSVALTFIDTPQQAIDLNQQLNAGYVTPQPK
ncbi:MAG: hypothetical protein M0T84_01685 [Betaproteobacteria bacterium]|nr:hypothetical protein [Betaproteobacteria bacterium]